MGGRGGGEGVMQRSASDPVVGGRVIAVIPARLGSSRFPEKVLASETGWPLIRHVVESARKCRRVGRVVVATDAERVADAVRGFGGEVVMTRVDHENGTSRLGEAAEALGLGGDEIVLNVQGDEPEISEGAVEAAVSSLEGLACASVGTAAVRMDDGIGTGARTECQRSPADDPNIVKVVRGLDGRALYFSRSRIPYVREDGTGGMAGGAGGGVERGARGVGGLGGGRGEVGVGVLRHVGVYAYRVSFLRCYADLSPTPLEQAERLEQLRVLEHGFVIAVGIDGSAELCGEVRGGIDTPEQYAAFVARWRADRS